MMTVTTMNLTANVPLTPKCPRMATARTTGK